MLARAGAALARVKAVGIAYLLWLAWKLAAARALAQADGAQLQVGFWQGVGLQFVNIKAWMLALALAAGWVATAAGQPSSNPGERLAIVCAVMAVFALASNLAYALAGSLLRDWLATGARLLWFNRAMALLLVATAVWMACMSPHGLSEAVPHRRAQPAARRARPARPEVLWLGPARRRDLRDDLADDAAGGRRRPPTRSCRRCS